MGKSAESKDAKAAAGTLMIEFIAFRGSSPPFPLLLIG
jgi:hypothetical protein